MAMTRGWRVLLVVFATATLGGCGKTVDVSFLNLTDDTLNVYVTTPSQGRQSVGLVPPLGRLSHTLMVPEDSLPATCTWQVGSVSQSFTVTKQTGEQEVTILPTGAARMRDVNSSLKDMIDREMSPVPAGASGPPTGP